MTGLVRRLWCRERGQALTMLLAFMALAVPLTTSALGLASTLSIDSRVKTSLMKSAYATSGGVQHLLYRLVYETGYAESLPLGTAVNYTLTLNDTLVTITVTKTNEPPPPEAIPPGLSNRAFRISKTVYPATASPSTQTTYTYTVLLSNMTDTTKTISNIRDAFPTGLTYVPGSTSGMMTREPSIVSGNLSWNPSSEEGALTPFSTKTFQFQMQGSLAQGVHCNDIWVTPGGDKTRSGLTAKIIVGSPASTLCPGTALQLSKTVTPQVVPSSTLVTFTYTITFTSDGTASSDVSKIIDLLPVGLSYVSGSTQGLTTADPSIVLKQQGTQQELTWSANPIGTIPPGGTSTLTFRATASLQNSSYFNEVTATVSGLNYDLYTWPTAKVQVVGVFDLQASDNKTTTSAEAWLNDAGSTLKSWDVRTN